MKEKIKNVIGEMLVLGYASEARKDNPLAQNKYHIVLTSYEKSGNDEINRKNKNCASIAEFRNSKGITDKTMDVYRFKIIAGDYVNADELALLGEK